MTSLKKLGLLSILFIYGTNWALAQQTSGNPIITHIRSADPSAQVWNDGKVWLYASHDQDNATDYSTMDGYHVFSSYDLVNWTDHGEILHSRDVSWGNPNGGFMFAPDAAFKNGTYYLYFPHLSAEWEWRVGVATSEKPEGPFTDIGRYMEGTDNIDPMCFVDEDGQAYLIWGGGFEDPKIARLKENMTELAEEPRVIEYGADNFGEGPFMHKRDGIYYFSYTCQSCFPYQGFYAMGDNPYGPFTYKGELNPGPPGAQDHHSIIEYHGQWYYFYHVGNYMGGSLHRRNVCIDSLFYNEDGTMQVVVQTTVGVGADSIGKTAGIMVPGRVEAEDYFRAKGIDTLSIFDTTRVVTKIHDSDWFDFVLDILGSEVYTCRIKVSDPVADCKMYLLVDEVLTDSVLVNANTDTLEIPLYLHKGKHTLKFLFSYPDSSIDLMQVDWIDLYGEINYYTLTASSSEGGSIEPDGIFYLTSGDSMEFSMDWELYFQPESLVIDGEIQDFSETYTFRNISDNHSIEAIFTGCSGTQLNPYIQVNVEDSLNTADITVIEGDQVILGLEYEDPGELTWLGPGGKTGRGRTLVLENIQTYQEGIYSAFLTNNAGCRNKQDFDVTVEPFVLEVYEAERWTAKSGVINDICTDVGGGQHLGYIDDGDWTSYQVEMDRTGMYEIIARVATASEGGEVEISVEDQILCSIPVSGALSDGWQDWYTTSPLELPLEEGNNEIKLTFKGGEGYLFNLNWFDLSFNRSLPVSKPEIAEDPSMDLRCYQLPGRSGIGIIYGLDAPSDVHISVVNLSGVSIRTLGSFPNQGPGYYELSWNGEEDTGTRVNAGIYFVVFMSGKRKEVQKVLFFP